MVLHEPTVLLLSNKFQLTTNDLRAKTPQEFGCNRAKHACERVKPRILTPLHFRMNVKFGG